MTVVIQCASRKAADAGHCRTRAGKRVRFVARPELVAPHPDEVCARPDDPSDEPGLTWRQRVLSYNEEHRDENPYGLRTASSLYTPPVYAALVSAYGPTQVYILSAGWGLISASFLTPTYDITFSGAGPRYAKRSARDRYDDFAQMPDDSAGPVVCLGGRSYVKLFADMTRDVQAERIVFYASSPPPTALGCRLVRYVTTIKTNWHYACANDLARGALQL